MDTKQLTDDAMMAAITSVCAFDAERAEKWRPEALAIGRAVERAVLAALAPSDAAGAPEAAAYLVTGLNESNEEWASVWIKRANADEAAARLYRARVTPLCAAPVAPAAPEGWKLVPVVPTQEMHDAGRAALAPGNVPLAKVFRAMVDAAPMHTVAPAAVAPSDPKALEQSLWELVEEARKWEGAYRDPGMLYASLDSYKAAVEQQVCHIINSTLASPTPTVAADAAAPSAHQEFMPIDSMQHQKVYGTPEAIDALKKRLERDYRIASLVPGAGASTVLATAAARDVLIERARQINNEGFSPEQDDRYQDGSLADAAACYALIATGRRICSGSIPHYWPQTWAHSWWKPTTQRRDLVKAGALILAEIERLDRAGGSDAR